MKQSHTISHNHNANLNHFYQEVIIDHYKHPRFKGVLAECCFCQEGKNPLCGDLVSIYCKVDRVSHLLHVHFDGSGCSISQASASIMCELVHNKTVPEVKRLIDLAEHIYTGKQTQLDADMESDLDALSGVSKFPARIKCAALPWKTLECLIDQNFNSKGQPVSRSCEKHLISLKQGKKLKIVSTEE